MPRFNSAQPMATFSRAGTIIIVVLALVIGGGAGYALGHSSGKLETQSVAMVNGAAITKAELYDRMVTDYGASMLDQLITEKLVDLELKKAGGTVTEADVTAKVNQLKNKVGGDDKLNQVLQANGMTMDNLKDNFLFQLKVEKILGKDVKTDDATLQKYFQDHANDFDKRQFHARHILVATEAEAKAIKAQLDQGADFAALAKAKSTDDTNKNQGGDLGTFGHGQMEPAFEAATFALKPKEISQPVETQYGWHVIQLLSVTGQAPTFEASRDEVKEAVISDEASAQYQTWIQAIQATAKITNTLKGK
ncbi:MAG: peptidylprolyl isomerase [Bacillota bacterium]